MEELLFDILVAIGSVLAGIVGALIGLGGGVIITPLLVLGFGVDIRYAMGAALCSVIATSSGAAAAYLRDGVSNMRIGLFLCVATTIGAVCGALLAVVLDPAVLSVIFGVALLATVLLALRKKRICRAPTPPILWPSSCACRERCRFLAAPRHIAFTMWCPAFASCG